MYEDEKDKKIKELEEKLIQSKYYENHYKTIPKVLFTIIEMYLIADLSICLMQIIEIIIDGGLMGGLIAIHLSINLFFPIIIIILLIAIFHRLKNKK